MKAARKPVGKKKTGKTARRHEKPDRLGRKEGCEVEIRIRERSGKTTEDANRVVAVYGLAPATTGRGKKRVPSKRPPASLSNATTDAFAAIGHPQRAKMLLALLAGPATYQAIQKTTKLKPGPLYHHINQLRLASLIAPRQRDTYELTRGGRNLAMLAIAAAALVKDSRRRPQG